jgi:hypothetical protein
MPDLVSSTADLFIFMFFASMVAYCFMSVLYYLLEK